MTPDRWQPEIQPLPASEDLFPGIDVLLLRLDRLHPQWGGNKCYKLHYNLQRAVERGYRRVLSFGGPWSNHLHALAAACHAQGLGSIGVVRGDETRALSPTLQDCQRWGMQLIPVSRAEYRRRQDPDWLVGWQHDYPDALVVPEGGDNDDGLRGCEDLGRWLSVQLGGIDLLMLGVGTGTTLAGVVRGLGDTAVRVLGVLAAPDLDGVRARVVQHCSDSGRFVLTDQAAAPGFGRLNPEQRAFWARFEALTGVELDPVYTLKTLYQLSAMARRAELPGVARVMVIHTGGLQGKRGFPDAPCGYNGSSSPDTGRT